MTTTAQAFATIDQWDMDPEHRKQLIQLAETGHRVKLKETRYEMVCQIDRIAATSIVGMAFAVMRALERWDQQGGDE